MDSQVSSTSTHSGRSAHGSGARPGTTACTSRHRVAAPTPQPSRARRRDRPRKLTQGTYRSATSSRKVGGRWRDHVRRQGQDAAQTGLARPGGGEVPWCRQAQTPPWGPAPGSSGRARWRSGSAGTRMKSMARVLLGVCATATNINEIATVPSAQMGLGRKGSCCNNSGSCRLHCRPDCVAPRVANSLGALAGSVWHRSALHRLAGIPTQQGGRGWLQGGY